VTWRSKAHRAETKGSHEPEVARGDADDMRLGDLHDGQGDRWCRHEAGSKQAPGRRLCRGDEVRSRPHVPGNRCWTGCGGGPPALASSVATPGRSRREMCTVARRRQGRSSSLRSVGAVGARARRRFDARNPSHNDAHEPAGRNERVRAPACSGAGAGRDRRTGRLRRPGKVGDMHGVVAYVNFVASLTLALHEPVGVSATG
jgi:hypothetical protein